MPYKDSEKQKGSNRERIRRYREKKRCNTQDVTPNINPLSKGKQLHWYREGKRVNFDKLPEGCGVLSDGQVYQSSSGSKFLSAESDAQVRENVSNTMRGLSGMRLQDLKRWGLSKTFTPNIQKNPNLLDTLYELTGYRYDIKGHSKED